VRHESQQLAVTDEARTSTQREPPSIPSKVQINKQGNHRHHLEHQSTNELEVRDVAVGLRKMSEIGRFGLGEEDSAPILFRCLKVSDYANQSILGTKGSPKAKKEGRRRKIRESLNSALTSMRSELNNSATKMADCPTPPIRTKVFFQKLPQAKSSLSAAQTNVRHRLSQFTARHSPKRRDAA